MTVRLRRMPLTSVVLLTSVLLLTACVGGSGALPEPSEAPEASLPEDLVESIAVRRELGLRSDPEWVRGVEASPDSVQSALGILVTPREAAEVERRFAATDRLDALIAYGAAHPDQFGGLYIDNAAGGRVVMLFTADQARHAEAVAELTPPGVRVEIRASRFTEAALMAVLDSLDFTALGREGYELIGAGVDTIGNVVTIDARSDLPGAKQLLEARFDGMVVANIYPVPGPWHNELAGDGWRLLASGLVPGGEEYSVRSATDDVEWRILWDGLGLGGEMPAVDLASEIVVSFGHGIGSSCPEVRLDGVVIDRGQQLVYSVVSDPLAPRGCTADLVGAAVFVVALSRDALPASPFRLQLHETSITCADCGFSEQIEVTAR